jgi:hypothetical protein
LFEIECDDLATIAGCVASGLRPSTICSMPTIRYAGDEAFALHWVRLAGQSMPVLEEIP